MCGDAGSVSCVGWITLEIMKRIANSHGLCSNNDLLKMRALFLIIALSVYGNSWSGEPEKSDVAINKQYTKQERLGTEKLPVVIKGEITTLKNKVDSDRDVEESKQKFVLDSALVKYNEYLAIFTLLLFVVATVQVVMFWRQLKLMKDTAKDSGIAAHAALDTARSVITAERAYVFVEFLLEGILQPNSTKIPNNFRIKLWNYGKTPAEIVMIRAYTVIEAKAPDALTEFEGSDRELPPGLGIAKDCAFDVPITLNITDVEFSDIVNWNRKLFCVGKIIYRDIFGSLRETGFCWHLLSHKTITPHFIPTDGSQLNYRK